MIPFHPLANLFPLIEGAEFEALVADVRANGLLEEIVLCDGQILDGRNRYRACVAAGVFEENVDPKTRFEFVNFDTDGIDGVFSTGQVERGPLAYVLSKNLARRHLNESQRAMVAARLATVRQGERTDLKPGAAKLDQARAAEALNVSPRLVRSAKAVGEAPALAAAVDRGELSVSAAATAVSFTPEMQAQIVASAAAGQANAVRGTIKKAARASREETLAAVQLALPEKRYGVVYADPEWRMEIYSRETGLNRAADNHYPTSGTAEICARPVGGIAADDCVLFLWAIMPMLPDALAVLAAWGFTYKTHAVWVKQRTGAERGMGYWFTGEHELLLVGTRGSVPAPAPGTQWRSVIEAPVGRHSEKPEVFAQMIEHYFPTLPKIELNARRARAGWDVWGFEAPQGASNDAPAIVQPDSTDGVVGVPRISFNHSQIPKPATEAAAISGVETDEHKVSSSVAFHDANVSEGVTAGEMATFDMVDGMPHFLRRKKEAA